MRENDRLISTSVVSTFDYQDTLNFHYQSCQFVLFMMNDLFASSALIRLFHKFVLCTHLWVRTKQLKHTLDHLKMPSSWGRRVGWLKALVWALHMAFCSVLGHYFSGMPAYLSGIETQMVGKHSQQL